MALSILTLCATLNGWAADADDAKPFQPIDDAPTLEIIERVLGQVAKLRGIDPPETLLAGYLDSETLQELVEKAFEKTLPEKKRRGVEQFLKSLDAIPEDLDIVEMFLSLLDEQVGGLYDPDSKRLYVRRGYDIAQSAMARGILAHEICHMLQDHAFDLQKMGIESEKNDDKVMAISTIAEGDAMALMGEYIAAHETRDILKDIPQALTMDQSALEKTPYFFRQQLLFPYIQGQVLSLETMSRGADARDRLFTDPPSTTEQVMHPERYFAQRDEPTTPGLLLASPPAYIPSAPEGFERLAVNHMGEFGLRTLFEERLGAGIAHDAAAGWDGDAYAIYSNGDKWWFCWETEWDSPRDAIEFQGAWVTHWRSIASDRKLGSYRDEKQEFQAGKWTIRTERKATRVLLVWSD